MFFFSGPFGQLAGPDFPDPFVHFSQASRLSRLWLILVSFANRNNLFNEFSANLFLDVLSSLYVAGHKVEPTAQKCFTVQSKGNSAVNLVIKVSNRTSDVFIFNLQPYLVLCSVFSFMLWQHCAGLDTQNSSIFIKNNHIYFGTGLRKCPPYGMAKWTVKGNCWTQ